MKGQRKLQLPRNTSRSSELRKSDVAALDQIIRKATRLAPFIQAGMLAYGHCRLKYAGGARPIGFASVWQATQATFRCTSARPTAGETSPSDTRRRSLRPILASAVCASSVSATWIRLRSRKCSTNAPWFRRRHICSAIQRPVALHRTPQPGGCKSFLAEPEHDSSAEPEIILPIVEPIRDLRQEVLGLRGRMETCLDTFKSMPPPAVIAKWFSVLVYWAMPSVV